MYRLPQTVVPHFNRGAQKEEFNNFLTMQESSKFQNNHLRSIK
jgi:hypothetical protein